MKIAEISSDVRQGLALPRKELPSRYFYDERGSRLFEEICRQPEYYVTRTESAVLEASADAIVAAAAPSDLVELGAGSADKALLLLGAMSRAGRAVRYVPLDVCRAVLDDAARTLGRVHPRLHVEPVMGDFLRDLGRIPRPAGRRLVAFLGSTLGNLGDRDVRKLLVGVRRLLRPRDRFLLGTDLVKDRAILERAYNDAAGVTAAFNRNILAVIARHLEGDIDPGRFDHVAFYDDARARIEMHLRARESHRARFAAIDLEVGFAAGETIRTEISRKWTRARVAGLLASTGLELERWFTDEKGWFGLSLARPA
jgi:L-histidine N-alpha-methyltransferase